ncbi:MAG: YceI family protein [Myxococcales bacterium]|nr:YceI family protein [Myxococcales bacterium]
MTETHQLRLFTFKAGLLSRVAHDLQLHAEITELTVSDGALRARIDPRSIVVDGTMRDGRLDRRQLDAGDRAKIVDTIRRESLMVDRHPTIGFEGRVEPDLQIRGSLELVGVRRPLQFTARRVQDRVQARIVLRPSDFGIAPYKALAGAIRLQDRVEVELDLDAAALAPT